MRSEKIEEIFQSAYEDFEHEPSKDAWQRINAKLDSKTIASYKRRVAVWRGVAILLLLLGVGFVFLENSSSLNGKQKIVDSSITTHSSKTKQTNPFQEFSPTRSTSSIENTITNRVTASSSLGTIGSIAGLSFAEPSINLDRQPVVSSVQLHAIPLANHISISILNIAAPRLPNNNFITIQKRSSPWTFTGFFAYERANYKLDNDLPPTQEKSLIQQREEHESSFSAGMLADLQIKERWSVETGLIYSNTQIGIKPQKMYASHNNQGSVGFKYVTSSGYAYVKPGFASSPTVGDSLTTTVASHKLESVNVPLSIKYFIPLRRMSFQPGVGVAVNFLTNTKVVTEIENSFNRESVIINKLDGTRPLYLSLIGAANLQYRLNNRWSLNVIPTFKYALTPITKDHVVKTFPYSIGIGLGSTVRL